MATKDEIKAELIKLEVDPATLEDKTKGELEIMLQDKQPMSDEEKAALAEASRLAAEALANQPAPAAPRTYTMDEVKAMFSEFKKELDKPDQDDEDEGPRKHTVRLPRLDNQFIVGFKNINNDPYFPDRIIYSKDIFNEQSKQFVPHTTVIFEDGKELTLPIETLFKVAKTIECELIERKYKDASEKYGNIEVQEIKPDAWSMKGTGNYVKGKANIKIESYVVKLPDGKVVEVIRDIINW